MIRRISTWFSPGKSGDVDESNTSAEDLRKVLKRVQRLEIQIDDMEGTVAHLHTQLQKLRGRVTGGIRHADDDDQVVSADQIPAGDKRRLREFARSRGLFPVPGAAPATNRGE